MTRILNTCVALAATSWLAMAAVPQTERKSETPPEAPRRAQRDATPEKRPEARPDAKKARPPAERVQAKTTRTAPALTPEQRELVKKAVHFETVHRERQARMNRLIRIYKAKGDDDKVRKLEEMKAKEEKRTVNALAGFREKLGEERWQKLDAEIKRRR